ncbi:MAG: hypothetical protein IJG18_06255 [Kiritimatiellae bacterium]|nr:hypothetical protein [Kiritimatiellia bacterium]
MRDMNVLFGRVAIVATALFALSASAGIKYWDNPAFRAFDVGCYVPGAVWNLDGIRNVGVNQPHSDTALTWKNLGSSGADNDVFLQKNTGGSGWAPASADELATGTYGEWAGKGFIFKGNSRMRGSKGISTGTKYTMQVLVEADSTQHATSFVTIFNSNWDKLALLIQPSSETLIFRTVESVAANSFASIPGPVFEYATAIANSEDNTEVLFSGTVAPTSGDGFRQNAKISGQTENGYVFGGANDGKSPFKGTFKFFRYYQKALSNEEVAWNRVVDERRFFDRAAPLPVTNAVVVSSVAASAEPAGTYAVDGSHVFTAPRIATVGNAKYICTGYTLETWDDMFGDWGTAVFHARELSCKVEDADCVRITWKWMDGEGLTTYDVSDYVWDGLELFYDGICNVGTNATHDATALTWKNLGSKDAVNDMFLQLLNAAGDGWSTATSLDAVGGRNPGAWTDNGFTLVGDSRFRVVNTNGTNGGIQTGTDYSLQTLVDAKTADQNEAASFVFSLSAAKYSMILYKSGRFDWRSDDAPDSGTPLKMSGTSFDYATAIANGTDNTLALFSGTEIPTSGDGFRQLESITAHNLERGYYLGGYGNANYDKLLVGTIKSFRQYNHALSAAEVAQNRKVDDFRFFGKFAETDVIVQSTYAALQGNEPDGEYDLEGSHTFTAPATATLKVNGKLITYACAGYTVEAQDGLAWTTIARGDGNSVAIAEDGTLKRLTWLWKPVSGIRTADDYGWGDYSQAGLVWNYDGLYNAGVGVHDSEATTWKNLGSGANADLHWNDKTTTGHWTDDGYVFAGGPRFKGDASFYLKNFTLQTLVDADASAQTAGSTYGSIFCGMYQYFNLYLITESYNGSAAGALCWRAQSDGRYMYFKTPGHHYDYATAIQDFDNRTAKIFPGVDVPTTPAENDYNTFGEKQRTCFQFDSVKIGSDTGYGLGQRGNETTWGMVGTLKNFRYYDRVLTEEEIIRNRNADAARYFGELGVTNVLEVANGNEEAYAVEGSWTFDAPATVEENGQTKEVAGFTTEELVDGVWRNKTWHENATYTYDASAGGKTIRLTWRGPRPGLVLVIR